MLPAGILGYDLVTIPLAQLLILANRTAALLAGALPVDWCWSSHEWSSLRAGFECRNQKHESVLTWFLTSKLPRKTTSVESGR